MRYALLAEKGSESATANAAWMLRKGVGYRGSDRLALAAGPGTFCLPRLRHTGSHVYSSILNHTAYHVARHVTDTRFRMVNPRFLN